MKRDSAEIRAADLQLTAESGWLYYAYHRGRNRWIVRRRKVSGDHYGASEDMEG